MEHYESENEYYVFSSVYLMKVFKFVRVCFYLFGVIKFRTALQLYNTLIPIYKIFPYYIAASCIRIRIIYLS